MTTRALIGFSATIALTLASLGAGAPAQARDHWSDRDRQAQRYDRYDRSDYRGYGDRGYGYDRRGYPLGYDRSDYRSDYRDRGYRDCRSDGAAGTIIGAIAGGLIGHEAAGRRGDRAAGTIIGGAVGAVAGRAIDRSDDRCR